KASPEGTKANSRAWNGHPGFSRKRKMPRSMPLMLQKPLLFTVDVAENAPVLFSYSASQNVVY
ncbi:hypothetical protein, partial [Thauera terpenica]|uniref:hypothetical protein n=1 Tax=Thauera terpenica TaxID=76113 RepID=UPI001C3F483B